MILLISTIVRSTAFIWSALLLGKTRDWRFGFLSAMLALMTARHYVVLTRRYYDDGLWGFDPPINLAETSGLAISVMALLAVFFIQGIIHQQRETAAVQRSIMECSPDFIMLLDPNGQFRFINRTMPEYTVAEVIGTSVYDYLPPKSRDKMADCLARVRRTQKADFFETEYVSPTGETAFFETRVAAVVHDGDFTGFVLAASDITQRKRSEQALRVRDHAIANAIVPFILADVDGEITHVNQAAADLWGYKDRGEMVNQPLAILSSSAKDIGPVMEGLRQNGFWIGERLARRKDGSTFPVQVSASVILDPDEKPFCLVGSVVDLTDLKKAEAEAQAGRERLADLSRALITAQETERHKLARELHDELGQVLTAVNFGLTRIKQKVDKPTQRLIEESQIAVTRSIDQIHSLSANLRPSVLDDFGLVAAVEWLVDRIRRQSAFEIELEVDDMSVFGDYAVAAFRFVQEALTNAMRHAQASRCWVVLRREKEGLVIAVRDDGKGFSETANRDAKDQRGAGLSNMRERVELIGGRFSLESSPGQGATVHAWLPGW